MVDSLTSRTVIWRHAGNHHDQGEFATLREKFGFVLVGKDGETPADCRSAQLVMRKLLELRASAVIDLYEMSPAERHRYVRLLSEAAINTPKNHGAQQHSSSTKFGILP